MQVPSARLEDEVLGSHFCEATRGVRSHARGQKPREGSEACERTGIRSAASAWYMADVVYECTLDVCSSGDEEGVHGS